MGKPHGFTLIEIAIVLAIIGLLVSGIMTGQELIASARVRGLIAQQDGVKSACLGFLDRFRSYPGDYGQASTNIPGCAACVNGNGNGFIRSIAAGDAIDEHIAVWDHLSKAGFINGNFTYAAGAETPASVPTNPYLRHVRVIYDNVYGANTGAPRHNVKTGNQIPSGILAEIDRKIDDGNPMSGAFVFSNYDGGGTGGTPPTGGGAGECYTGNSWAVQTVANCGGTSRLQ